MAKRTDPTFSVRLSPEEHAKLESLASARGCSMASLFRYWLAVSDWMPEIPPGFEAKLQKVAHGNRRPPHKLVEDALRRVYSTWAWQ